MHSAPARSEPIPGQRTLRWEILQDASTRIIFEYIIQPKAVKSDLLTVLDGMLKVSIASLPMPVPPLRLRLQRPVTNSPDTDPPPPQIVQALSRLMLYRMQERARKELEKGNVEKATRHLRVLASNLLTQGERSLAQTILLEVDHLQEKNALSAEGSKKMNYGTRALLVSSPKKEQVS
jgi:Ca-activated chloride channel family protein